MKYTGQFPKYEFSEIRRLNPYWSSLVCFHKTIKGRNSLHPRLIRKWFGKLIDQDDYVMEDRNEVINYAIMLASGNA
ncbi:MAG: hypothetical protein A2312_00400 [Candidatus Staskawiczbacteria bacterium RIFOXYB2_FULL_32_9]|uniref:Uncharacterized protein n=1 Tax=Candidatus Staskawiczbacteria bacterium RIFOXYD1_FULL_32_13 TaxID=1802234 RepID=A0A1G2JKP6_9BACT|nr:MAG: hypothetical protein UR22_C0001G0065 [Parcubacteria group bacterium GW2011_GWC2_32_10]OGZ77566.1 MAG: hypothetical protein A2256_02285 [Candidatus Staskawiczbacteria bacterium RIFOXYA2_FULL_32_7]OGZ78268.1 MAG: hypothetical protein A2360_03815 [Candidatus Staskawiczbacteria bacterium RIFOXYB1_FULL_32_11]OGZ84553.1 MAG: hypothetical protein A2312_00400 [Candidatus Staskawiczbacteria bacterium RIFOXYB2_FULL_32_9]OGZ87247.1 MAG: hypothetical protein A2463_02700 [Candidatus Staskawiczbacter